MLGAFGTSHLLAGCAREKPKDHLALAPGIDSWVSFEMGKTYDP